MTRVLDADGDGRTASRRGDAEDERLYRELAAEDDPPRDDGGGYAVGRSSHTRCSTRSACPRTSLAGGEMLNKLAAVRLMSALLGGLIAACAVLLVLELAPRRRGLAAAAGVAVAFQPMFAFMAGS